MAGGIERDCHGADLERLAIAQRLRGPGEILAIAQPHQIERLLGGEHAAMTGARMIGMAMGDHRLLDRPDRIDMEAASRAAKAGRRERKDVLGAHLG